jgi:hypothetical protein
MMGAETETRESEYRCRYDQPLGSCEVLVSPFLKPSQRAR